MKEKLKHWHKSKWYFKEKALELEKSETFAQDRKEIERCGVWPKLLMNWSQQAGKGKVRVSWCKHNIL